MKKIQLGKTDMEVCQLGLGCIDFGTTTDEKTAFTLIDKYLELGGNFLDTANNYAVWNGGEGRESEQVIGSWLARSGRRKDIILATKLGALVTEKSKGFEAMQGLSRRVILEEVEKSLDTLKTDYIDLLYIHIDDYKTPQEETMAALAEVVKKGQARAIGCSNMHAWRLERARNICEKNGYPFFSAIQQRYSYLQPATDGDFGVQLAADKGLESYIDFYKDITMVSHTSLLFGLYHKGVIDLPDYDTAKNREKLRRLCASHSNPTPWVLDFITKQFGGSVALFTTSKVEHLIDNMKQQFD